ncbi:uncharacterized protein BP01DRAFT_357866 [Aspergillus saccharolyticus JOP 1030-1]|uniref:Uncharacterized protein n=1 Tax=Aspergillus saccharolyticus JOP 1030-1 TaxID=1450539 RepID=A0A318ZKE3_9EURO|nr:hypothetical protein BP01DRAFT_357866 [Aspergillus saccharolyticus JOP 1030-1]PYH44250.1 hypothetical protein BP01DRAFT_357866 [Aspergillus saccharolyticus JOP 1030-1]
MVDKPTVDVAIVPEDMRRSPCRPPTLSPSTLAGSCYAAPFAFSDPTSSPTHASVSLKFCSSSRIAPGREFPSEPTCIRHGSSGTSMTKSSLSRSRACGTALEGFFSHQRCHLSCRAAAL